MDQFQVSLTTIVAVYAALVATGGLIWQIYIWLQSRKPQVAVEVSIGLPASPEPEWWIMVKVINRGDYTVNVNSVGFDLQDGSGRSLVLINQPPPATIPGTVAAHDQGFTYIPVSSPNVEILDLYRPLIGWANLATGEHIESTSKTLRSR